MPALRDLRVEKKEGVAEPCSEREGVGEWSGGGDAGGKCEEDDVGDGADVESLCLVAPSAPGELPEIEMARGECGCNGRWVASWLSLSWVTNTFTVSSLPSLS